ncbi:hypothetical protein OSTOST_13367 [Ostertagia ostertagi]
MGRQGRHQVAHIDLGAAGRVGEIEADAVHDTQPSSPRPRQRQGGTHRRHERRVEPVDPVYDFRRLPWVGPGERAHVGPQGTEGRLLAARRQFPALLQQPQHLAIDRNVHPVAQVALEARRVLQPLAGMTTMREGGFAVDGQLRPAHRDFENEKPVVAQREVLPVRNPSDQVAAEQEGRIVRRPALAELLGDEIVAIVPGVDTPFATLVVIVLVTRDDEVGPRLPRKRELVGVGVLAEPVVGIEEAHILPLRGGECGLDRPVLAPVVRPDRDDVPLGLQPVPGAVGAAVVDDHDLDVCARRPARLHGLREGPQPVEGRNYDGDVAHALTLADSRWQGHRRLRALPRLALPGRVLPVGEEDGEVASPREFAEDRRVVLDRMADQEADSPLHAREPAVQARSSASAKRRVDSRAE